MVKESAEERGMPMVSQNPPASPWGGKVGDNRPLNKSFKTKVDCHQKSREVTRDSKRRRAYSRRNERS